MANHKRFIEIAKNWQNFAALGRRRISYGKSSKVATKGHVVIQTVDKKKFMVPLSYLNSMIFRELFKMSEEEFGLPSDGPVVLPCNAFFMEYALSLLKKQVSKDVERALFTSITPSCCSSSYLVQQGNCQQQLILYGF